MKPEELMIGDWVMWNGKPVQVASVSGVKYSFGQIDVTLAHCSDEKILETHDIKSIQPIPITPEILEKNGFVKYDGGYKFFKSNDENYYFGFESIFFNEETNLMNVTKEMCSGKQTSIKGYFNYVHKLQHALKLCGIDKTIEL